MAGELWRSYFQIGLESTAGTTVAATRRMYWDVDTSKFSNTRPPNVHRFATASRETVRAFTLGSTEIGGTIKMPLSASEIVELLLMGIKSGVTPTGAASTKLWTFTPGTTLSPATIEWTDGARAWKMGGCYVNKLKFSGSVKGDSEVEAEIFAMNMAPTTMTGSLAERVPDFISGWETQLYIDAFGGTPGTTAVDGVLLNWNVEIDNGMGRKYMAANSQNATALTIGELAVTAKLTFEASAATAATEFTNWNAGTKRMVRLMLGNNEAIEMTTKKYVAIDIPGAWDAVDLGGSEDGTRTYELSLQYVYDTTNNYGLRIRAQNARGTAW